MLKLQQSGYHFLGERYLAPNLVIEATILRPTKMANAVRQGPLT